MKHNQGKRFPTKAKKLSEMNFKLIWIIDVQFDSWNSKIHEIFINESVENFTQSLSSDSQNQVDWL